MNDFATFILLNSLQKNSLADFLGVSNSFITKLCKGEKKLPEDQKEKIMNNPFGWDTSILRGASITAKATARDNNIAHAQIGDSYGNVEELAILRKENELLRERLADKDALLADKDAQIDFLKQLLTK